MSRNAPEATRSAGVEVRGIGHVFRSGDSTIEALRDVTLDIPAGRFVSIIGPSGCGKSTLLLLVAGLVTATHGSIMVDGQIVDRPQSQLGFVFQDPVLLDWRDVLGNVMLQAEAHRLPLQASRQRALELLDRAGLGGFERRRPYELSGGMRQRVAICRAVIHQPPLLLMDEPFGALDALTRDHLSVDLQKLWKDSLPTVIFVTHSIPEAVFLADRVVVMSPRPGRVVRRFEIDLPRPRHLALRGDSKFAGYVSEITRVFQDAGVLPDDAD